MVSAETSSQSQSSRNRSRLPPAPILPGRCATCNTQSTRFTYSHPPNDDVLRIFRRVTGQATQQHFYCSHCIKCATQKMIEDRALAQQRLADSLQRSAGHSDQERSDRVVVGSQPSVVDNQTSAVVSNTSTSTEETIVRAVSAQKRPRPLSEDSRNEVPSPPPAVRFAVVTAGHNALIDPDDIVPPSKRQKPSQKPRIRKQLPPTTVAAVPRSPGGTPISNAEYVRTGGG